MDDSSRLALENHQQGLLDQAAHLDLKVLSREPGHGPGPTRASLERVAAEAMANGIPVLARDRGAPDETLGDTGFVLTIPERYIPSSAAVPSAREGKPWVALIERPWDDREFEARHRAPALAGAARWDADRLVERYDRFFDSLRPGA
jgi:glycosyltransferase involved in cell wall biosynthesis